MSPVEALAVLLTLLGIGLTGRRRVEGFPLSLGAALLYLCVFIRARLFADAMLQLVFAAAVLKGWHDWRRAYTDESGITVRHAGPLRMVRDCGIGVVASAALATALSRWTSDAAPVTDATLSVFSVIGQIWTGRRFIECWALWIVVDTAYIGLFIGRSLWLTAGLYLCLVLLASYALVSWHRARSQRSGPDPVRM
ncbi:nicotinamide riboside transporter PnuC [Swaminathania salitolerans]|uniref:Nicotinamide riboside transporter PnuC n=1 Tax=Swaminathania salitolerans TaxID=182838 RepID=A0A511BVH4_9PROT|nr:nicotinamide riboside transporter PnuC [Swaminathania salitolerans]GBQ15152.1 transporter of nicotinamide mononucleotide PnuC [Swaminathania salitolerans LMG 21291]GEL02008.1 transporter [Swaminathania salitolerans]